MPEELRPEFKRLLKGLLVDNDMSTADDAFNNLKAQIEALPYTKIIAPGDLNSRRIDLLLATSRGDSFLIKRKGHAVGVLAPPDRAPDSAIDVSSSGLNRRGTLFSRLEKGESFLLHYRGRVMAALLSPTLNNRQPKPTVEQQTK
ncbi:hypothetical protein ACFL6I_19150 [candidate division KSB1 bacterium]